jgi:mannose-6-phosphate isomerase class I
MTLNKGESIVISADEPHAYISGELVECMVNSDNVIRGGLTPKFKDTETLVSVRLRTAIILYIDLTLRNEEERSQKRKSFSEG